MDLFALRGNFTDTKGLHLNLEFKTNKNKLANASQSRTKGCESFWNFEVQQEEYDFGR